MWLVDANYVLRWFLGDVPEQSKAVEKLLTSSREEALSLDRLSIAEITYVLRGQGYDHHQIFTVVLEFCRYPSVKELDEVDDQALKLFAKTNLDFEDCWLAAKAQATKSNVATFDKQLQKLIADF